MLAYRRHTIMILVSKYTFLTLANPMGAFSNVYSWWSSCKPRWPPQILSFSLIIGLHLKSSYYELEIQTLVLKTVYNYVTIDYSDEICDTLPKVRNMIKYEVTEWWRGDFYFGPDSHLLWPRLMICGILLTFWVQQCQWVYLQVCSYRPFVNPIWLPLNISLIKLT